MNENFELSLKNKQRALTRFHAQEMLLQYALGTLDPQRRQAMDQYLLKCKDTQKELAAVRSALEYCEGLSELHVSQMVIAQIADTRVGWEKWSEKLAWRNWPDLMRWLTEAVVVAAVVAAIVSLLPMQKLTRWLPQPSEEVILTEVKPETVNSTPEEVQPQTPAAPTAVATPVVPEKPTQVAATAIEIEEKEEPKESSPSAKGPKGFVYRLFMATDAIDLTTQSVRDLILSLDGAKAGQVELGWRKSNGTYFHFTVPESNFEALEAGLRVFGPVRIYKDPHWRVMPEGQIRLILFVEDKSPNN